MQYLSISEVQYVAHRLARELLQEKEPISDSHSRYPKVLEGCLNAPRQTFAKKELYPTLHKKAAALFYFIVKDHPFQNGNKRVAVMTLLYFLDKNGEWLKIDNQKLYNFSKWVAASDPVLKSQTVSAIEEILKRFCVGRG